MSLTREAMNGAIIEPIRAHIDPEPSPVFLTTVGNNSVEYRYRVVNPTDMPTTPRVANPRRHHSTSFMPTTR